jgi:hypothetical protein
VKIAAAAREQQTLWRITSCIAFEARTLEQPSGSSYRNRRKSQRSRGAFNPQ